VKELEGQEAEVVKTILGWALFRDESTNYQGHH